ncbi:TolC family protein [Candidatus Omnitrophota bacterium]
MRRLLLPIFIVLILQLSLAGYLVAGEEKEVKLSLETVSELALENNLDIQLAKYDAYIKRNDLYGAVSIFDTILNLGFSYEDDQRQTASTLAGTQSKTTDYSFGLEKKFPTGTTVGIGLDHTRNWSNSAFVSTNPYHDSEASISLTQEVGKNFFGLIDRNNIKITKLDIENSDYTSLDKIENYLAEVQKAYWKVIYNRQNVDSTEDMLDRAISLHKIYIQKIKTGLAESPDLYAAEANMNIRENELLLSQNSLRLAENDLLLKLNLSEREDIEIITEEIMSIDKAQPQDFIECLTIAIERRRDYKQALNEIESKKLNLVTKKNSLWPEIDLKASFVRNGVAQRYSDAIERITDSDNPKYYYGITITYPLENNEAKGEYESAQLEKAKALVLLKKNEREIVVEIKDAVSTANTTLERVRNNLATVQLQEAKLDAEEKRFRLGRSDSDTLVRYQDDLLQAKISLSLSLYKFYSDLVDLRVKENSLLEEYWTDEL